MSKECTKLHKLLDNVEKHCFPFDENKIPLNGIYILFERGEIAHMGKRIVRIGTHKGINQLRSRLKEHFLKENKDRSIFRKNIGRAILKKDNNPFLKYWELDLTTKESKNKYLKFIDINKQNTIEKLVSKYIRENFSFGVIKINDKNERLKFESKLISTVSLCNECNPSNKWLGNFSTKEKIRKSGLWLVNELYKTPLSREDLGIVSNILIAQHENSNIY